MQLSTDESAKSLVQVLYGVLAQVAEPVQVPRTILDLAVTQTGPDRRVSVEVSRTSVPVMRTSSVLCMPIRAGGKIAALVHLESREAGHFRGEHEDLLRPLLELAGATQTGDPKGRSARAHGRAEKAGLDETLRRYPKLGRAELAAKLKISESALYSKLHTYGLVD